LPVNAFSAWAAVSAITFPLPASPFAIEDKKPRARPRPSSRTGARHSADGDFLLRRRYRSRLQPRIPVALAFGVLIVILVIGGSLWIMANLNHNMMPMDQLMQMQR
jgi:hypothetical protein